MRGYFQDAHSGRPAAIVSAPGAGQLSSGRLFTTAESGRRCKLHWPIIFFSIIFRMRTAAGRQRLFPRRGLLASYRPVGCPLPPPVADDVNCIVPFYFLDNFQDADSGGSPAVVSAPWPTGQLSSGWLSATATCGRRPADWSDPHAGQVQYEYMSKPVING
jgi:hypothetical protein